MAQEPEELPEHSEEDEGGPIKPFLEHLEDLRWVLIKGGAALMIGMLICLIAGDKVVDILKRPLISYWAMRYGADLKTPTASIQGPKVMLIDETAGSGGDLLPWMFHKFEIGPLVGKRTWGGLVGILGFPTLMDGGGITAPNLAIWTEDGWVVENEGVPPDIEVEQTPADVIAGHDPQLEKAIEIVLKELEKNPPKKAVRPPYHERMKAAPSGTK